MTPVEAGSLSRIFEDIGATLGSITEMVEQDRREVAAMHLRELQKIVEKAALTMMMEPQL